MGLLQKMKNKKDNNAAAEIIGTVLMLLIATASFSVIYVTVLSDDGPDPFLKADVESYVEGLDFIVEHRGGQPLSLDSEISIDSYATGDTVPVTPRDYLSEEQISDGSWDVGERLVIPLQEFHSSYSCMYGSPALDYKTEEIMEPVGRSEVTFRDIINNYTKAEVGKNITDLSDLDLTVQWSSNSTVVDIRGIEPEKNMIAFTGSAEIPYMLEFQEWKFSNASSIHLKFEYVDGKGGHRNTFFYYVNRDKNTKNFCDDEINNKDTLQGTVISRNISTSNNQSIGFGIESDPGSNEYYWYTNIPLNSNKRKQALVYNLGRTELGPEGSYLIGFEDLDRNGDSDDDFQDLVVIVHVVDCS